MIGIKDQCFGCEIEMTGISRRTAAQVIADLFGTSYQHYEAVGIEVTDAYYKLGTDRVKFALNAAKTAGGS